MDIAKIGPGPAPPWDVHVLVEIPQGSTDPVKYEFDKESGALFVDRFLHTAMFYPGNYGFIPDTLSDDGDPIDVLVISRAAVVPGSVIRSRPVAALVLRDEAGGDEKIVAVPVDALHPFYGDVRDHGDLPEILRNQIAHFFRHYKDLEKDKWVSEPEWAGADEAARLIEQAIERAASSR